MLASALPEGRTIRDYTGDGWILEEKYDGHRLLLEVCNGTVIARSRAGNARVLPTHLRAQCEILAPGTYDGELYLPGGCSTDVTALDKQHLLHLVLFDMLTVGDQSAMHLPAVERRTLLDAACCDSATLYRSPQFAVSEKGLKAIWARGGEGAVIKKIDATYRKGKRVKEWIKFKCAGAAKVTITGFKAGSLGPHSVIIAQDAHCMEVQVKTLNDDWRANFATTADAQIGRTLVISYQEKTRDGRYRHPMADHLL